MSRAGTFAALTVLLAGSVLAKQVMGASESSMHMQGGVMFVPSSAQWSPAPPGLPKGAEVTVLEGDPTKPGLFTIQIKMPDGYKVKPHTHPTDERQTVVKGELAMGMGPQWNESEMKSLTPGGYVMLPKGHAHYVVAKGETILQVEAHGPFDLKYVNPTDDPRKSGK